MMQKEFKIELPEGAKITDIRSTLSENGTVATITVCMKEEYIPKNGDFVRIVGNCMTMERKIGEMKPLEPMSDRQAMQELIDYILGKDWYVVDPLSQAQVNAIAVEEIKGKGG